MERRNAKITTQLVGEYSRSVLNQDLRVWCVSNTDYEEYKHDSSAQNQLELSGILSLRSYCQLIPAQAQFTAVTAFLEHQIPALVGSLRQWVAQGSDSVTVQKAEALKLMIGNSEGTFNKVGHVLTVGLYFWLVRYTDFNLISSGLRH